MPDHFSDSLAPRLREVARAFPAKVAVVGADRSLTHAELDLAAMDLARRFLADGFAPGDRVAVMSRNTVELVVAVLACLHAGLVLVPVNTRYKVSEIRHVLAHSGARRCLCESRFADAVAAAGAGLPDAVEVLTRLPGGIAGPDPTSPPPDAPAVVLYTSGTTARPKGVTHSLRTLAAMADAMRDASVAVDSVTLVATPAMHVSGLCATLLPTLVAGGIAVLLPAFDPEAVLDAIQLHRCNHVLGLPALMQFVAAEQERRPRDTRSVRTWLCGGDSVPLPLQQRWLALFGSPLIEGYAMSENCPMACNRASAIRPGSVGRPVAGTEIRIMGYDGIPAPIGAIGEIEARGPANFIGYWDDPESTARTLVDGWLRTGDLGRLDADGYLWFEGRRKEIIVRGGSNIAPQEVEEALLGHPAVLEAGVVGMPDPVFGERVVAFVALCEGRAASAEEVREFAGRTLADYKVPERVVFLESMPKGPTGKVLRRALKELASA